jgi:hypothetical protein
MTLQQTSASVWLMEDAVVTKIISRQGKSVAPHVSRIQRRIKRNQVSKEYPLSHIREESNNTIFQGSVLQGKTRSNHNTKWIFFKESNRQHRLGLFSTKFSKMKSTKHI